MPKTLYYAGIGSRQTPQECMEIMFEIAQQMAPTWTLRSGAAHGADTAFYEGAMAGKGQCEIFLPWNGFNGFTASNKGFYVPTFQGQTMDIAKHFHPNWDACSPAAKKMHGRNVCQVAGLDLNTKTDLVICWTKDGKRGGGTGQALRIAEYLEIPIFDLAIGELQDLADLVNEMEATNV